jgi:hypothetical protein
VFDQADFFARRKAGEHQDGFAYASFADGYAFFGAGYAEPVGAGLFEGFGDLGAAVAVAVAFDDAEDFARGLAVLFVPRSTSAHTGRLTSLRGLFCSLDMSLPRKNSLRHPAARSGRPDWMPRERQHLALQAGGLEKDEEQLSKGTSRFLVNIADKGLTRRVSPLDATLT